MLGVNCKPELTENALAVPSTEAETKPDTQSENTIYMHPLSSPVTLTFDPLYPESQPPQRATC